MIKITPLRASALNIEVGSIISSLSDAVSEEALAACGCGCGCDCDGVPIPDALLGTYSDFVFHTYPDQPRGYDVFNAPIGPTEFADTFDIVRDEPNAAVIGTPTSGAYTTSGFAYGGNTIISSTAITINELGAIVTVSPKEPGGAVTVQRDDAGNFHVYDGIIGIPGHAY